MPWEQVYRQHFIRFPLLLSCVLKSLQLHEGFGAVFITLIEITSQGDQGINIFCLKFFFILNQTHSCLHCTVVVSIRIRLKDLTFDKAIFDTVSKNEYPRHLSKDWSTACLHLYWYHS
jgi:hypothetical protein